MRRISRRIVELYRKHFAQKLFNKILFTYSLIVILTLATLSFFIYKYFTQYMYNKETARQLEVVASANVYMDQRIDASRMITESLYANDRFMRDIAILLEKGYSEYLNASLDRYLSDGASTHSTVKALSSFFNSGFDIESIRFANKDGQSYQVNDQLSLEIIEPAPGEAQNPDPPDDGYTAQSRIYPIAAADGGKGPHLYAFSTELRDPDTLAPIGRLMINFKSAGILASNPRMVSDMKGYLLVLTRTGDVILDSSGQWYGRNYPVSTILNSDGTKPESAQDLAYTTSTANKAGVIVAGVFPYEEVRASLQTLKRWIVLITALCMTAAMLLTFVFILRFSRRTKVIVRAMEKLDVGQWNVRIPLSKGDELYQISSNFNKMSERVVHYIEKVYVSEIKQKNAEIIAMQMQMNPHFLYNTLEAIRMNAVAQGVPEVGHMIYLLATLFRKSMKSAMILEIADEMERCRLYLELFQIRYPERLEVVFQVDDTVARYTILKLSIQPLVENYVLHGFRADRTDNQLIVAGEIDEDMITIRVRDNGKGIATPDLLLLQQSLTLKNELDAPNASIGLRNVNSRLQMVYGSDYGLEIHSEEGKGTEIILRIPAVFKE